MKKNQVRTILIAVTVLLSGVITLAYAGGFTYRTVYSESSPTGNIRLQIKKRFVFSLNELIDPSIAIQMTVRGDSHFEVLFEDSDLTIPPDVHWHRDRVIVSGYNDRNRNSSITLSITQ